MKAPFSASRSSKTALQAEGKSASMTDCMADALGEALGLESDGSTERFKVGGVRQTRVNKPFRHELPGMMLLLYYSVIL